MTFPNAYKGIKKVFLAEILALIGSACTDIGSVIGGIGLASGSAATGTCGWVIVVAGRVFIVLCLFLTLVGLKSASRDDESFQKAFVYALINLIISMISVFLIGLSVGSTVLNTIIYVITLLLTILTLAAIFKGIESLAHKLNRYDVAEKGSSLISFLWIVYCVTIFCEVMGMIVPVSMFIGVLALAAALAMFVAYILYLGYLGHAKNMLASG